MVSEHHHKCNASNVKRVKSRKDSGGRVVRRCWVNFQCRGVLLIWIIVGQGPVALAVGAGGGCLDIFSLICPFSPLSPSLWETARYRLKYCLKGPLNPKQPTNQNLERIWRRLCFGNRERREEGPPLKCGRDVPPKGV